MVLDKTLSGIKAIFLDLDGTIYLGDNLIEGSLEFLSRLEEVGIKRFFLSNNSSRSVKQYVSKLQRMGIPATEDDVRTHKQLGKTLAKMEAQDNGVDVSETKLNLLTYHLHYSQEYFYFICRMI